MAKQSGFLVIRYVVQIIDDLSVWFSPKNGWLDMRSWVRLEKIFLYLGILGAVFGGIGISSRIEKTDLTTVTVAAASSLQGVLEELIQTYQDGHKSDFQVHFKTVYGSSGLLAARIISHAPYDLFLSADETWIDEVKKSGRAFGKKLSFANGKIAIWGADQGDLGLGEMDSEALFRLLISPKMRKIAVPNSKLAPYGRAAEKIIHAIALNEEDQQEIEKKLVFGENARQALQFVQARAADLGLVPLSLAKQVGGSYREVSVALYSPVQHFSILLNSQEKAQDFQSFLLSRQAQSILLRNGFSFGLYSFPG